LLPLWRPNVPLPLRLWHLLLLHRKLLPPVLRLPCHARQLPRPLLS
jgi:hypothetical protein